MGDFTELKRQQNLDLPLPHADLTGKTVLITGGNTGLGYEAARHLASLNPSRLIITSRTAKNGAAAIEKLQEEFRETRFEAWELDMCDFRSVKRFGDRVERQVDRLDIYLANAGMGMDTKQLTQDGFEMTLQANNISNTYLAHRLLPLLERTASSHPDPDFKPHVTIVSSGVHYSVKGFEVDGGDAKGFFQTLTDDEEFEPGHKVSHPKCRYSHTKAINVLDTLTLASLASDKIVVNTCDPGFCHSSLGRDTKLEAADRFKAFQDEYARPTEKGARVLAWSATTYTPSGSYIGSCEVQTIRRPSEFVRSERGEEVREMIWADYKRIWAEKIDSL